MQCEYSVQLEIRIQRMSEWLSMFLSLSLSHSQTHTRNANYNHNFLYMYTPLHALPIVS